MSIYIKRKSNYYLNNVNMLNGDLINNINLQIRIRKLEN